MKDFTSKNYLLVIERGLKYGEVLNGGFVGSVTVTPLWAIVKKEEIAKMKNNKIAFVGIIFKIKKMKYLFFLSKRQAIKQWFFILWLVIIFKRWEGNQ